jgi:VIT1/CCC1 family predicted Fe2+/Mn2+ transporter
MACWTTHGVLDYVVGALLIVVPYLLGFADGTAAQWVPQVLGLVAIGGGLMTDYERSPGEARLRRSSS